MIKSIYCHHDGYPSGVGATLIAHYKTQDLVEELVGLGGISSLGPMVSPRKGLTHTFSSPQEDVTVAYVRDRGEGTQNNAARLTTGEKAFECTAKAIEAAEDGKWPPVRAKSKAKKGRAKPDPRRK